MPINTFNTKKNFVGLSVQTVNILLVPSALNN